MSNESYQKMGNLQFKFATKTSENQTFVFNFSSYAFSFSWIWLALIDILMGKRNITSFIFRPETAVLSF